MVCHDFGRLSLSFSWECLLSSQIVQTDKFAKVGKIDIPNGKYNCKNVFVIIIAIIIATSRKYFRNEESEADIDIAMNFSAWTCQETSSKKS